MSQPTRKGDRWKSEPTSLTTCIVTRMSRTLDWVDIACMQVTEGGYYSVWSKRMPEGIPDTWVRAV